MTNTNPLFRTTKSRRLVSAWTVQPAIHDSMARVREFADMFDQIVLMCGAIQEDGALPGAWSVKDRKAIADELRTMGVSMLNDYGGVGSERLHDLLRRPDATHALVKRLVEDCIASGADGVDIDIEHWPASMRLPFSDFIIALSKAMHEHNLMLSICVYSLSREARRDFGLSFIDTAPLATYVDHFRVMNYDLFCPPSPFVGPTCTAPWVRENLAYMKEQVPSSRIIAGLPTYSVDWDINEPQKSRQVNDAAFIAEREAQSPIGRGWCSYWDVGLIRYTDELEHAHLLWVSDARSTRSHLVSVDSLDVAGVCFWLLSGTEDPAIWQAVHEHFARDVTHHQTSNTFAAGIGPQAAREEARRAEG